MKNLQEFNKFYFFILCFNLTTAKFISKEVSKDFSFILFPIKFVIIFSIFSNNSSWFSLEFEKLLIVLFKLFNLVKVSIIKKVVLIAFLLFNMVANIYKPFSVKAFGSVLLLDKFVVENFDRKKDNSFLFNSNK